MTIRESPRPPGLFSTAMCPVCENVLDLNLPRRDGREVLTEIKADGGFKHIPVVILTSSQDEEDILQSYRLHANCYISKPIRFGEFVKVVKSIEEFWFTIVTLPATRVS